MNTETLLDAIGSVNDRFITALSEEEPIRRKPVRLSRIGIAAAACLCLVIGAIAYHAINDESAELPPAIATYADANLEAKIVSFETFEEMENYANVIVRVTKGDQENPVIIRSGDNIISGFTFSQVKIDKIYKDRTGELQSGTSIRILENEFFDEQSKTVYHVAGYNMMKEGAPYLLFLTKHTYGGENYYVAAGIHFGTVSLSEDGRTIRDGDEAIFRPFWDEAKKKYNTE